MAEPVTISGVSRSFGRNGQALAVLQGVAWLSYREIERRRSEAPSDAFLYEEARPRRVVVS